MKRFTNLLKKEIKELANKQLIFTLLFTVILFQLVGQISKKESQKSKGVQTISALDEDGSEFSKSLLKRLESEGFKILDQSGKSKEQAIETAKTNESKLLVVIPKGFGDSIAELKPGQIETYSYMKNFSLTGIRSLVGPRVMQAAEKLSNDILAGKLPGVDLAAIKNPVRNREFVVIKERVAEGSAAQVAGLMWLPSMIISVVLMMIVIYSSQMVISAVAMEKQNKTLETLLTVPIKRTSIITAKMLAAGLVGLLSAAVYMFGFQGFISGIGDGATQPGAQAAGAALMQKLGLTFDATSYVIMGLSIFLAILVALAMAMILGVLAEDFRSAQTMIMPLMFMVMIPYFLTLFIDVNTLSLPVKLLFLAIPFSHPFLTTQNLYLGNWGMIAAGLGYMLVVFIVLVMIAARIFSTDKILTMKLRFGKKKPAVA